MFSIRKFNYLALGIACAIPPILATNPSAINVLDYVVGDAKTQLNFISNTLTGLAGMIDQGQISSIKNRKLAMRNIRDMVGIAMSLQMNEFRSIDIATTHELLRINQALMSHLTKAFDSGLVHIPPFPVETLAKRGAVTALTIEQIQRSMARNVALMKKLELASKNAGLRWYNKAYRAFDAAVISPCQKYNLPMVATISAGTAFVGFYMWRFFDETSFRNKAPHLAYRFFGPLPDTSRGTGSVSNEGDLSWFGKLEYNIYRLGMGIFPIGAAISYGTYAAAQAAATSNVLPWVKRNLSIIHNKLRGGIYVKQANKLSNHVDEVSFDDLVGVDHVKEYFKIVVDYLKDPEHYDRLGLTPSKGILLIGETRTGKTYSVKALFGEIKRMQEKLSGHNFNYFEISANEIHEYPDGIKGVMHSLRHRAPCILFIDEIDLLNLQRNGDTKTLSEFLTCMSGALDSKDPRKQIIIIAATNQPENLDKALRQPGRFGKELRYEYPKFDERLIFIKNKLSKICLTTNHLDVEKLAHETANQSFEAISRIINSASLTARIKGKPLTQQFIDAAVDEEMREIISVDHLKIPESERRIIATHFAGQALAFALLDLPEKLDKVTMRKCKTRIREEFRSDHIHRDKLGVEQNQRFTQGKLFTTVAKDSVKTYSYADRMNLCQAYLAGFEAEKLLLGACGYSCNQDAKLAAMAHAKGLAHEGIPPRTYLDKTLQTLCTQRALSILAECEQKAYAFLEQHRAQLERLVEALMEKDTLTAKEVAEIIKGQTA